MRRFWFCVLVIIMSLIVIGGAKAQMKISGPQIRDGAIDSLHLSPSLSGMLAFLVNDSAVAYANVALTIRDGAIYLSDFNPSTLDSIKRLIIQRSDTANIVLSIANGVVTDSLKLSANFRDQLFGRGATPFIYKSRFAGEADSSVISDYAREAGIADSARNAPTNDSVQYANKAGFADIAFVAISTDTTVGDSVVGWSSLTAPVKQYIRTDSVQRAKRADSLSNDAISSYNMFNSTMKSTYIPTSSQKAALASPTTPSGNNPYIDTTTAYNRFTRNLSGPAGYPLHFLLVGSPSQSPASPMYSMAIDTANGMIILRDVNGTRYSFVDSLAIRTWVQDSSVNYIRRGSGAVPATIHNISGTPSGATGLTGDWAMDITTPALYYKSGASTWDLVSGGGGGADSAIFLMRSDGVIHVDSTMLKSKDVTVTEATHTYDNGATLEIKKDADLFVHGTARVESLFAFDAGELHSPGNQIWMRGVDTLLGGFVIGRNGDSTNSAMIQARSLLVMGESNLSGHVTMSDSLTTGSVIPSGLSSHYTLGKSYRPWYIMHALRARLETRATLAPSFAIKDSVTNDSIRIDVSGGLRFRMWNTPLTITGDHLTLNNGNFTHTGGTATLEALNAGGFTANANGGVIPNTKTLTIASGGTILVKADSTGFADLDNTAIKYFLVNENQKNALLASCPDPSGTNFLVTKGYLSESLKNLFRDADTLYAHRRNANRFLEYKIPSCDDTLTWTYGNDAIVWPTYDDAEIVWPSGPSDLIIPWMKGTIPIGPYWIDSSSNGLYYHDPGPGYAEQILQVSERFDSRFGRITGKYQTLQNALDSLPNFRCGMVVDVSWPKDATSSDPDTHKIDPDNATVFYQLKIHLGNTVIDTVQGNIPPFLTEPGTWVKFNRTTGTSDGERWCEIIKWFGDTAFVINDNVPGTFTWVNGQSELTFAKQAIVEVLPPVNGGYVELDTTVSIGDWTPVKIVSRGGPDIVKISNTVKGSPDYQRLFGMVSSGIYTAMPLHLDGFTLFSDSSAGVSHSTISVDGNVRISNCKIVSQQSMASLSKGIIEFNPVSEATSIGGRSLFVDNTVIIADSNSRIFIFNGDSVVFASENNAYSTAGETGHILYHAADVAYEPFFSSDQFLFRDGAGKFGGGTGSLSADSLVVWNCLFVGAGPSGLSFGGDYDGIYNDYVSKNAYDAQAVIVPPKLREGYVRKVSPFIPK